MQFNSIKEYNLETPFPSLFCSVGDVNPVSSDRSGFSFYSGIPSTYSSLSGKKVDRADINGIGRLITQSRWFSQLGGYYTFDQKVSDAIGGYPDGAILYFKDSNTGYVRPVRSLIPDNTFNFVETPDYINNEYWSFVDEFLPSSVRPKIFPTEASAGVIVSGGNSVSVDSDSLLVLQTGIQGKDSTKGQDSASFFLEVKRYSDESFYTAAMVGFLPSLSTCWAQGDAVVAIGEQLEVLSKSGYSAYYSSSPIQTYLNAGDEFRVVCSSNETDPIQLQYQIFTLEA